MLLRPRACHVCVVELLYIGPLQCISVLPLCSVTSCQELESSIYTPVISISLQSRAPHPCPSVVKVCQHTTSYAHLFSLWFLRFVNILMGWYPLLFLSLWFMPFRVFFFWFEERVEINLCILGTGFRRAGFHLLRPGSKPGCSAFSQKTDLYPGPK